MTDRMTAPGAQQPPMDDQLHQVDNTVQDPRRRTSRLSRAVLVAGFLAVLLPSIAAVVKVPYAVFSPGPATNVLGEEGGKPVITISGDATVHKATGRLYSTSVYVGGGPGNETSALDALIAAVSPRQALYDRDSVFPKGASQQDVKDENAAMMVDSQQEAAAVALTELGYKVTQKVTIADFPDGSPAQAAGLRKGDQIVAIDGKTTSTLDDVRPAVRAHKVGDKVAITVLRAGQRVTTEVTTQALQGQPTVGVFLALGFDFPFSVQINLGETGGPSAGLMFALGVYDDLTPGELTGGTPVAGTGTIDYAGTVGSIGGIRQKMLGARDQGARWFLAPADNCSEVVGHVPGGMRVVKVSTFDQAKDAITAIAAKQTSNLPTCTAG